jgi:hypothetical protein
MNLLSSRLLCVWLTLLSAASAMRISEILPDNQGGLQDEDGSSSGWIELYNETAVAVNLTGWHLTDEAALPSKWTFPATTVAANGYLVVFASGKNRAVSGSPLHANFKLDPDGEYLALTNATGSVVASFTPTYAKLRTNVSYAVTTEEPIAILLTEPAATKYFVPADGSLGQTWTAAGFVDSAWSMGDSPLGFDAPGSRFDIKTVNSVTTIPAPSGWTGITFPGVTEATTTTVTSTTSAAGLTMKIDAIGAGVTLSSRNRQGSTTDGMVDTTSNNNVGEDFIFALGSTYTAGTPRGLDVTISGLATNTVYPVTLWAYDRASATARVAAWTDITSSASAVLSFNGADGQLATDAAFNLRSISINATSNASGQILLQGRTTTGGHATSHNVYLNAIQVGAAGFNSIVRTNVASALQNNSSSIYTRNAFSLANPGLYDRVRLRVRYDDGFNAYLNGQLIASRNAPLAAAWNNLATEDHAKAQSLLQEEIIVNVPPGLLVAGANVLALQGLKQSNSDVDFILSATLDALAPPNTQGRFYATPTPGAVNATTYEGFVADTKFSVNRGYYSTEQSVILTCATPGATIRYTLDGSAPTATTGTIHTAPINVSSTTIIRAAAFLPGWIPSNVDTQSYLFLANIISQPVAPAGWPTTWGTNATINTNDGAGDGTIPGTYAMDPRVVTNTAPGYGMNEAFTAIPTLSIAMAPSDFLGTNGIYQNPLSIGIPWERNASVELIDPTAAEPGFHETCRIEIHGNSSRNPWRMQKHSMRLSFKADYGAPQLKYPFFPGSKFDDINKLILRATFTDGWGLVSWTSTRYRPDDSVMFRDVWVRRTWEDMGNLSPESRFVHLMINGLYWGVYDASEHIDADYVAAHQGGLTTDWEVVRDFVDPDTSATSPWKSMFTAAAADLSLQANYQAVLQWLDPVNFADYYLMHQFAEAEDWPHHNGAAWRNKVIPGSKYKWVAWDQEIALQETGATNGHNIDRISPNAPNTTTARTPGAMWNALRANKEWRLLVADRAHALLNNDGPLSQLKAINRWESTAATLDKAIVAESARWGDTVSELPYGGDDTVPVGGGTPAELLARKRSRVGVALKDPYLRDPDWIGAVNYVTNTWIPSLHNRTNTYATINRLANQTLRLWPATEPPVYAQHGGNVPMGYQLPITTPTLGAVIYYTLDGTDPRESVTGNAVGTMAGGTVPLGVTGHLKSRAVTGVPGSGAEIWSALTDAEFIVGTAASASNLAISEIYYHPPDLSSELEFIELVNFSTGVIDLTNVRFTEGITYAFPDGTLLTAGQRIVVTGAQFTGKLDNNGEFLTLLAANDGIIQRFRYNDAAPWPSGTDGDGRSLVFVAPGADPTNPVNWRASETMGGTSGLTEGTVFSGDPVADSNGDGFSDFLTYALGGTPQFTVTEFNSQWTFTFIRAALADDVTVTPQASDNLETWTVPATLQSRTALGGGLMSETWAGPLSASSRLFFRLEAKRRL